MSKRGFRLDATTPLADRIYYYVAADVQTRCWNWIGALDPNGYGMTTVDGRPCKAHRVSYEAFVGTIPDGFQIDHLCRNRSCVNPEHIQAVTAQTNVLRSDAPGAKAQRRSHCLNGHAYAEHGVIRAGRRICRQCNIDYRRQYQAKRRAARREQWQARGVAA